MKKLITVLALSLLLAPGAEAAELCRRAFLYFDLGQTLVDTDTNQYNPMFYLKLNERDHSDAREFPSAKEYIDALADRGHQLGILADIPGDWGVNYPANEPVLDLPTAKVLRTMHFLAGLIPEDGASWAGEAFDWSPFVEITGEGAGRLALGRLFLPQSNSERKKVGSLAVFQRGVEAAKAQGCPAVFQGEQEKEMELAEKAGMIPYWVGHTVKGRFFLAPSEIAEYVRSFKPGAWRPRSE